MRANRRRDTKPERLVRAALHAQGFRYRVDYPVRLAGVRLIRPDIAFTRIRLAVFIDGCFWHGCPDHKGEPKTNTSYWGPKLEGNRARDQLQTDALRAAGWTVLRFWEHEAADSVADQVARKAQELSRSKPTTEASRRGR